MGAQSPRWWIWKFGGSSLATGERINHCAKLVVDQLASWNKAKLKDACTETAENKRWSKNHLCVVVSAMGGITNLISTMISTLASKSETYTTHQYIDPVISNLFATCSNAKKGMPYVQEIYTKHIVALNCITDCEVGREHFRRCLLKDLQHIINGLDCVSVSELPGAKNYIVGFGELWSRQLFTIALNTSAPRKDNNTILVQIDSREVIIGVDVAEYEVSHHVSASKLHKIHKSKPALHTDVITLCSNENADTRESFLPALSRSDLTLFETQCTPYNDVNHIKTPLQEKKRCAVHTPATQKQVSPEQPSGNDDIFYTLESENDSNCSSPHISEEPSSIDTWPFPTVHDFPPDYWPVLPPNNTKACYPGINFAASYDKLLSHFRNSALQSICPISRAGSPPATLVIVAQGFVCRTNGFTTISNLGRNGSDTSAVAYGVMLKAEGCTIWSDVEGIYTADPRICPHAVLLRTMSYDEALELASFGAKVLHPACLIPASHVKMPLLLKSTFHPERSGTLITDYEFDERGEYGKAITTLGNVTLITVQNRSSVPKFMSRLFSAADDSGSTPLLISQSSTTSAITVGIEAEEEDKFIGNLVRAFKYDVSRGARIRLTIERDCSLLCITGRGQSGNIGALAAWCDGLAKANVSIKAVSQSSNELSTCFAVKRQEENRGLHGLHNKILEKLTHQSTLHHR